MYGAPAQRSHLLGDKLALPGKARQMMLDDPYAPRAYAYPAADRILSTLTDDLTDDLPYAHGPLRLYAQRLLLLALILYTVLALLFVVSSRSFAAPLDASAAHVETSSRTAD
jgi:hypothetical protein